MMLMCRMVVWRVTASVTATEAYLMGQCVDEVLATVMRRWRALSCHGDRVGILCGGWFGLVM